MATVVVDPDVEEKSETKTTELKTTEDEILLINLNEVDAALMAGLVDSQIYKEHGGSIGYAKFMKFLSERKKELGIRTEVALYTQDEVDAITSPKHNQKGTEKLSKRLFSSQNSG